MRTDHDFIINRMNDNRNAYAPSLDYPSWSADRQAGKRDQDRAVKVAFVIGGVIGALIGIPIAMVIMLVWGWG